MRAISDLAAILAFAGAPGACGHTTEQKAATGAIAGAAVGKATGH